MAQEQDPHALANRVDELEQGLRLQRERFRSIQEIALALGTTLDVDELLGLIMTEVTRLMGAERSTLFLVDRENGEVWSKIAQEAGIREIRVRLGEGLAGFVAETGEVVRIGDAYEDRRFQPDWDQRTGFRTRSVLCLPVTNKEGTIIGVIQVLNKLQGSFGPDDESLLAALASQAAVSLENSRLYRSVVAKNAELLETQQKLERKMFELEFLYETEQAISRAQAQEEVIESVIARTCEIFGTEAGSILLLSETAGDLYFKYAVGERREALKRFRMPLGKGIAGWVAQNGLPLMSNDPSQDPRHHWPLAEAMTFPARSIICVPLRAGEKVVGAFELINKRRGEFSDDDLKVFTLVAGLVSRAIQEVRYLEEREKANRLADLGQMLSGVLHDLKTPMTVVSGYAQLMVNESSRNERETYCDAVLRQFDHLSDMTRELLAFARGDSEILFRRVYVHRFFEELGEILAPEFEARNISLEMELRYKGRARFDEGKIRRAMHNIARNAMEAMRNHGVFRIDVFQEDNNLVVTLGDTGPGIPEDIQDRLFESFVSKGKSNGTGLGLAIVKKIVTQHGGQISFETQKGKGTKFSIRLPLEPDPSASD